MPDTVLSRTFQQVPDHFFAPPPSTMAEETKENEKDPNPIHQ